MIGLEFQLVTRWKGLYSLLDHCRKRIIAGKFCFSNFAWHCRHHRWSTVYATGTNFHLNSHSWFYLAGCKKKDHRTSSIGSQTLNKICGHSFLHCGIYHISQSSLLLSLLSLIEDLQPLSGTLLHHSICLSHS
jgi:hypothetical protein